LHSPADWPSESLAAGGGAPHRTSAGRPHDPEVVGGSGRVWAGRSRRV